MRYFEAYELLMDELRDYRWYKPDMLHPSEQAVDFIFQATPTLQARVILVHLIATAASFDFIQIRPIELLPLVTMCSGCFPACSVRRTNRFAQL